MHRAMGMMGGTNKSQLNPHHRNNQGHGHQQHQPQHPLHQTHHSTSSAFGTHPADLNPMDFIEQDIIQGGSNHQGSGSAMMSSNTHHGIHQTNSGGLVGTNFDVNLDAPFDMMSAFPDLDPSQFTSGGQGHDGQHSPLLHQNVPGPMLGSSPMNNMIKNEGGIGINNRNQQQAQHHSPSNNAQQLRQPQQQQHSSHMHHLNHQQHQQHSHGHPHISDYSPEWGWTDVSKIMNARFSYRGCDRVKVFVS